MQYLRHVLVVRLHDAFDGYPVDLVSDVIQSIDYNDVMVHDEVMTTADHKDRHSNILLLLWMKRLKYIH